MTSRERLLAALDHKEPDKVPVDLGSHPSSGISVIAYNNLKKHLKLYPGQTRVYDVVQQLAEPEEDMLDRFGIDIIDIGRLYNRNQDNWYPVQAADGSNALYPTGIRPVKQEDGSFLILKNGSAIAKMPSGGTFFDQTFFPYLDGYPRDFMDLKKDMDMVMWGSVAVPPWDHASEPNFWNDLRQKLIDFRETSDRAVLISVGCNLFEWGSFLRRMDNFLMDVLADPDNVAALLEALMEIHMQTLTKVCEHVGDLVDVIKFGDDLGMINGPFMPPVTYRELFKPHHKYLNEYTHAHSTAKTLLHSCGSIYALLPDLIEAGFDAINPVQTNCLDMQPEKLKSEFGKDITFWGGGVDTATVLNRETPDNVYKHVIERLNIFAPGGGYVFNTVHNILPEVPPENIMAMFNAVKDFNG